LEELRTVGPVADLLEETRSSGESLMLVSFRVDFKKKIAAKAGEEHTKDLDQENAGVK